LQRTKFGSQHPYQVAPSHLQLQFQGDLRPLACETSTQMCAHTHIHTHTHTHTLITHTHTTNTHITNIHHTHTHTHTRVRAEEMVQHLYCSSAGPNFFSFQNPHQESHNCNSRSGGFDTLFWPPEIIHSHEQTHNHTHTHIHSFTNKVKIIIV